MKKLLSILCWALIATFISCDDEKLLPKEHNKGPVITLISPAPADSYHGEVLIQATATGKHKITGMEIWFDNQLMATSTTGAISYAINTADYANGTYSSKIVATDKKGNVANLTSSMTLINQLSTIKLNLVINNPEPNVQYFYYLLNEEGAIVGDLTQVDAGTTEVVFNLPPDHTADKKYAVAYVEHHPGSEGYLTGTSIRVITGYTEGTYNEAIGFATFTPPDFIGSHQVNFVDLPSPLYTTYINDEGAGGWDIPIEGLLVAPLSHNASTLYIAAEPNPGETPIYKVLTDINVNESTVLHPADFAPMNGLTIPPADGSFFTFSYVWGYKVAGDYSMDNQRLVWMQNPYQGGPITFGLEMYYPGDLYPEYLSGMIESFSDHADEYVSFGSVPTEWKRLDARITGVTIADNVFNVTSTGSYDFLQLSVSKTNWDVASWGWRIFLPDGNVSYSVPQVPQELTDMFAFPQQSEWVTEDVQSTYIVDYSGLEGYDSYFDETYRHGSATNSNEWAYHSREFVSRTAGPGNSSARMRTPNWASENYVSVDKYLPAHIVRRK